MSPWKVSPVFSKYRQSLLQDLWAPALLGSREHLSGTIKQNHCHTDSVLSTCWWGCMCQQFRPFWNSHGSEDHHHYPVCVKRPTIFGRCLESILFFKYLFSQSRLSENACWLSQQGAPQQHRHCSLEAFKAESMLAMLHGFDLHFFSIHNLYLKRNVFYSTLFRAVLFNLFLASVY